MLKSAKAVRFPTFLQKSRCTLFFFFQLIVFIMSVLFTPSFSICTCEYLPLPRHLLQPLLLGELFPEGVGDGV